MQIKWNEVTPYSKLLTFVFFLCIVPILTYYINLRCKDVVSDYEVVPVMKAVSTKTVQSLIADSSKWKMYENTKFGITFLYPSYFNIHEDKEGETGDIKLSLLMGRPNIDSEDSQEIVVEVEKNKYANLDMWFDNQRIGWPGIGDDDPGMPLLDQAQVKNPTVAGLPAKRIIPRWGGGKWPTTYFENRGYVYQVTIPPLYLGGNPETKSYYELLEEKFLSTIEFTK